MDRSILDEAPRPTRRPVREPPVMPQGNPEMDDFCEEVMRSRQNPAEMLRRLYGQVFVQTNFVQVYVQGSSKGAGTKNPKGVAAVFWGETSTSNRVLSVPGPEPPSNNRAAIYAALLAVKTADPNESLLIFTNSEYMVAIVMMLFFCKHGHCSFFFLAEIIGKLFSHHDDRTSRAGRICEGRKMCLVGLYEGIGSKRVC
jgi:hypothetical protein